MRRDAEQARKSGKELREKLQNSALMPSTMASIIQLAEDQEARAQELDRQADALDGGGKPAAPWWRSFPIPFGGDR